VTGHQMGAASGLLRGVLTVRLRPLPEVEPPCPQLWRQGPLVRLAQTLRWAFQVSERAISPDGLLRALACASVRTGVLVLAALLPVYLAAWLLAAICALLAAAALAALQAVACLAAVVVLLRLTVIQRRRSGG